MIFGFKNKNMWHTNTKLKLPSKPTYPLFALKTHYISTHTEPKLFHVNLVNHTEGLFGKSIAWFENYVA